MSTEGQTSLKSETEEEKERKKGSGNDAGRDSNYSSIEQRVKKKIEARQYLTGQMKSISAVICVPIRDRVCVCVPRTNQRRKEEMALVNSERESN